MNLSVLLKLAEYAHHDSTLVANHVEHGVPERLRARKQENEELISQCEQPALVDDTRNIVLIMREENSAIEKALTAYEPRDWRDDECVWSIFDGEDDF